VVNWQSTANRLRQGDRIKTSIGEIGHIEAIENGVAKIQLRSGLVISAPMSEVTFLAPGRIDSSTEAWRRKPR
jgi:hypothetical protein